MTERRLPDHLIDSYKGGASPVDVFELFPELSDDIDRRISHSEVRLKFWILSTVMANALVIVGATLPTVYYLGEMNEKLSTIHEDNRKNKRMLSARGEWMNKQEEWNRVVAVKFKMPPPPTDHLALESLKDD